VGLGFFPIFMKPPPLFLFFTNQFFCTDLTRKRLCVHSAAENLRKLLLLNLIDIKMTFEQISKSI